MRGLVIYVAGGDRVGTTRDLEGSRVVVLHGCRRVARLGMTPLAPSALWVVRGLHPEVWKVEAEDEAEMELSLLSGVDGVLLPPGWREMASCVRLNEVARERGIPVSEDPAVLKVVAQERGYRALVDTLKAARGF